MNTQSSIIVQSTAEEIINYIDESGFTSENCIDPKLFRDRIAGIISKHLEENSDASITR